MTTDAPETPTLTQLLQGAVAALMRRFLVALPGTVDSYDRATQTAQVTPAILDEVQDEDGVVVEDPVPLRNVPVVFAGGLTYDLAPGDSVLLVFTSRRLDDWNAKGGRVVAKDQRVQHRGDAIAIPGLRPRAQKRGPSGYAAGASVLEADDLRLGSSAASDPVARKSDLAALKAAIQAAVPGTSDGGAALKTSFLSELGDSWPVCSSKVKVE